MSTASPNDDEDADVDAAGDEVSGRGRRETDPRIAQDPPLETRLRLLQSDHERS
jgi:hypothetical protein